jgi:hypothetical protein
MQRNTYIKHLELLTVPVRNAYGRTIWISPVQYRLICQVMKRRQWNQRALAVQAGYADPSGVSRALASLRKLSVLAVSTSRGRKGSTVAWLRRGVQALGNSVATLIREMLPNSTDVDQDQHRTVGIVPQHLANRALLRPTQGGGRP